MTIRMENKYLEQVGSIDGKSFIILGDIAIFHKFSIESDCQVVFRGQ